MPWFDTATPVQFTEAGPAAHSEGSSLLTGMLWGLVTVNSLIVALLVFLICRRVASAMRRRWELRAVGRELAARFPEMDGRYPLSDWAAVEEEITGRPSPFRLVANKPTITDLLPEVQMAVPGPHSSAETANQQLRAEWGDALIDIQADAQTGGWNARLKGGCMIAYDAKLRCIDRDSAARYRAQRRQTPKRALAIILALTGAFAVVVCLAALQLDKPESYLMLLGAAGGACALQLGHRSAVRAFPDLDPVSRVLVFITTPLCLMVAVLAFTDEGLPEWVGWSVILGALLVGLGAIFVHGQRRGAN